MISKKNLPCLLFIVCSFFSACGIYSFTGVNSGVKTASVQLINNQAAIVNPSLSGVLTEKLKNKIITNSPVTVVEQNGEIEFSGTITSYQTNPVAASANETAALNRLNIIISIQCINKEDEKQSWVQSFSRYTDFNSSQDLSSVESQLVEEITDQLVDDIFNKALVNW